MKLALNSETVYCFDTNALIWLDTYYKQGKVFGPLWDDIDDLLDAERFIIIEEVYDEVFRHEGPQSTWLKNWMKGNKKRFIRETDEEAMVQSRTIIRENKNTGFIKLNKMSVGIEEADPYLIAHAAVHGYVIVTQESQTAANRIPKVAKKYEVRSINLLTYLHERGFELTRKE
jgi:hypothetical protein